MDKEYYTNLVEVLKHVEHDVLIRLIGDLGVMDTRTSALVSVWAKAHGMEQVEIEFETATAGGGCGGSILSWRRRGKSGWGNVLAIRPARYVDWQRMWYILKDDSPQRIRHLTRNELKFALGDIGHKVVRYAMRWSSREFVEGVTVQTSQGSSTTGPISSEFPNVARIIQGETGLSLREFWRAARKGDAPLARRLGLIERRKRVIARKRGMTVAEPIPGLFD